MATCALLGIGALIFGILAYSDWQWLHAHFSGVGETTRWTEDRIQAKLTVSILLMVAGALGVVTFFLGFFFVRKALDEDKVDDVKKWSLISGVTGLLPGAVFAGLLELFIWRAHSTEAFTIFGLLGQAPAAEPPPEAAAAAPAYDPAAAERARKAEYMALFAPSEPAAPPPSYGYAPQPAYAAPPAYGAPQPAYAAAPAAAPASQMDYAYAQAEPAPAEPAGTQYVQPSGAPVCTCGRPMEWVAEYNRYYCYTDDKYEGEA